MSSPYDVLGVDPEADPGEIERAYRRRVKETHPDQGGTAAEFQAVRAAYDELRNGLGTHTNGAGASTNGAAPAATPEPEPVPDPVVEYLDYEAVVDHGWDLEDEALFDRASEAGLDPTAYGRFLADRDELLLETAEDRGFRWPYSCRGGACANCAVKVIEGELSQPVDHILPEEHREEGIRLSCVGKPLTDELKLVFNVKHRPDLEDLRLPPRRSDRR